MRYLWLALCLLSGSACAAPPWLVAGPDYQLRISPRILARIPLEPDPSDTSPENIAGMAAHRGSPFFAYIRDQQDRLDWWAIEIVPDDPDGVFVWPSDLRVYCDANPTEFVLTSGCQRAWSGCRVVFVNQGIAISYKDLGVPFAHSDPRVLGYIGTPAGQVDPSRVEGFSLGRLR